MVNIREKREDDLNALRELFLRARRTTFTWLDTTHYNLSEFDDQTKGELILVAVSEDAVIGFISLWVPDNFIHHLYVDSRHQHRNIGSALLFKAMEILKFPIKLKCLDRNLNAMGFYKRKGFVENGTRTSTEGLYTILQLTKADKN